MRHVPAVIILLLVTDHLFLFASGETPSPPYPPSEQILGIEWDFDSIRTLAPGSDNWPITWSDDDRQYTSWGDGGGFSGTNQLGRVSLGFASVEGGSDNYQTSNIWGGFRSEAKATFGGKCYGIISVKGILYAWLGAGGDDSFGSAETTRVIVSKDKGITWLRPERPMWTAEDVLYLPTFLNFGKDNDGARDDFVYSYFPRGSSWALHKPGKADLGRVPQDRIADMNAFEWFAGLDSKGRPCWTADLRIRESVFEDQNGLRTVSVTYNPVLKSYLLTSQHSVVGVEEGTNQFGVFAASEPWGPWQTVAYESNWQGGHGNISFYFAPKWWSEDGREFTLIYTNDDHWSTIKGIFLLRGPETLAEEDF